MDKYRYRYSAGDDHYYLRITDNRYVRINGDALHRLLTVHAGGFNAVMDRYAIAVHDDQSLTAWLAQSRD